MHFQTISQMNFGGLMQQQEKVEKSRPYRRVEVVWHPKVVSCTFTIEAIKPALPTQSTTVERVCSQT
jgi:hypothetical protein